MTQLYAEFKKQCEQTDCIASLNKAEKAKDAFDYIGHDEDTTVPEGPEKNDIVSVILENKNNAATKIQAAVRGRQARAAAAAAAAAKEAPVQGNSTAIFQPGPSAPGGDRLSRSLVFRAQANHNP